MDASRTSQALRKMSQTLRDPERALRFEEYTYTMMFGHYKHRNWRYWAISPSWDMLAICLWEPDDVIDNLSIAMLMEAVGIGPWRYCIYFDDSFDDSPEFYHLL